MGQASGTICTCVTLQKVMWRPLTIYFSVTGWRRLIWVRVMGSQFSRWSLNLKKSQADNPYEIVDRRAGDVAKSFANANRASELLKWSAKGVPDMCQDAWNWVTQKN